MGGTKTSNGKDAHLNESQGKPPFDLMAAIKAR
jgi:DNA-binding winged helix-turn-helix (wHTH) protein